MALTRSALRSLSFVTAIACAPAIARAQRETSSLPSEVAADRPHTVTELGLGALTLPSRSFCIPTANECVNSDVTLLVSVRSFFKWRREFGVGAGVSWGFRPISDDATIRPPDEPAIARSHTRNYFLVTGAARWYPLYTDDLDVWVGATGGLVVVSDRYSTKEPGTSIIGPKAVQVPTEGGMVGAGVGVDYFLGRHFTVGAWTYEMYWSLPNSIRYAQTGDPSTVHGAYFVIELGLSVGYRIRI